MSNITANTTATATTAKGLSAKSSLAIIGLIIGTLLSSFGLAMEANAAEYKHGCVETVIDNITVRSGVECAPFGVLANAEH